jgi:membrane-bound serine protease (ClpP class)
MVVLKRTLLILFVFLLVSPVISFSLRAALSDSSSADTIADTTGDRPLNLRPVIYTLRIEGAIGTVTDALVEEAVHEAENNNADLLVIFLDTPGGFTSPTWEICKSILNSRVPVCTFISPSGARAGSAGVYITYASHIAAMAPSTNIGAAHPVGGQGQDIDSVMNEKVTNDAVAQIKAAAAEHGRNAEWAEKAVRESVSITDREALEMNVIDLRARNLDDLLDQLDGREVKTAHGTVTVHTQRAKIEEIEMSFIQRVLEVITSPDVAFILFSIGGLGIILELYNPGAILPGVVGAISLILAFYAFQTLPINYAGLALIILGIILFIAEIKVVSHGILTIGGLISLFFGGLMLVDTVDPDLRVSMSVLWTVVITVGVIVALAGYLVIKAQRSKPFSGNEGMVGKTASVRNKTMVYVDGALWKAQSVDGSELEVGSKVEIVSVDSLLLTVRKITDNT